MVDEDVINKLNEIVSLGKIYKHKVNKGDVNYNYKKISYLWSLDAGIDVYGIMKLLYSYMGERRKLKINECLNSLENKFKNGYYLNFNKIENNTNIQWDDEAKIHYLAGLFEAEGCIYNVNNAEVKYPRLSIEMTDLDIIKRISNFIGNKNIITCKGSKFRNQKQTYKIEIGNAYEVYLNLNKLIVLFGIRRKNRAYEALDILKTKKEVIEKLEYNEIYDKMCNCNLHNGQKIPLYEFKRRNIKGKMYYYPYCKEYYK
jgi:hypothetical protein